MREGHLSGVGVRVKPEPKQSLKLAERFLDEPVEFFASYAFIAHALCLFDCKALANHLVNELRANETLVASPRCRGNGDRSLEPAPYAHMRGAGSFLRVFAATVKGAITEFG